MRGVVAILAVFLASTVYAAGPLEVTPPQNKLLISGSGRYIFGQISDMRRDQYMLDTQTERLWQFVVDKDQKSVLQPVEYIQLIGGTAYIPDNDEEAKKYQEWNYRKHMEEIQKAVREEEKESSGKKE